jgi:hypothetical protein
MERRTLNIELPTPNIEWNAQRGVMVETAGWVAGGSNGK